MFTDLSLSKVESTENETGKLFFFKFLETIFDVYENKEQLPPGT